MEMFDGQRAGLPALTQLNKEAILALQPLHDDLQSESSASDGIVYFSIDRWHRNNASAVATVQPQSDDVERFAFYKKNIKNHRIDLAATALNTALHLPTPQYLRSRMNPHAQMTWGSPTIIDGTIVGGAQAALNPQYGELPAPATMQRVWDKHTRTVQEVAGAFYDFSRRVDSIGDTLELLAPATPDAYIISWDLDGSTNLAQHNYGALRNYLLDTKRDFITATTPFTRGDTNDYHDTGDGQDVVIRLPDGVNRADPASVKEWGEAHVLPLVQTLFAKNRSLVERDYTDIQPEIRIVIGLGYVEEDRHNGRTSTEYWEVNGVHKTLDTQKQPLGYTAAARTVLFDSAATTN